MMRGSYSTSGSVFVVIVWMYISLSSCAYSHLFWSEQGRAFETAPGKQIKGKGSSSSSRKISTPGSATSTHSPDTLIFNQVHTHSCWLSRINVYPWKLLRGLSLSLVQMHIFTEYNQAGQPLDAGTRVWEVYGSSLCVRLRFQLHAYISEGLAAVIQECLKKIFPKLQCTVNTSKPQNYFLNQVFDITTKCWGLSRSL